MYGESYFEDTVKAKRTGTKNYARKEQILPFHHSYIDHCSRFFEVCTLFYCWANHKIAAILMINFL